MAATSPGAAASPAPGRTPRPTAHPSAAPSRTASPSPSPRSAASPAAFDANAFPPPTPEVFGPVTATRTSAATPQSSLVIAASVVGGSLLVSGTMLAWEYLRRRGNAG